MPTLRWTSKMTIGPTWSNGPNLHLEHLSTDFSHWVMLRNVSCHNYPSEFLTEGQMGKISHGWAPTKRPKTEKEVCCECESQMCTKMGPIQTGDSLESTNGHLPNEWTDNLSILKGNVWSLIIFRNQWDLHIYLAGLGQWLSSWLLYSGPGMWQVFVLSACHINGPWVCTWLDDPDPVEGMMGPHCFSPYENRMKVWQFRAPLSPVQIRPISVGLGMHLRPTSWKQIQI